MDVQTKATIKCGSLDLTTTRHKQHLFLYTERPYQNWVIFIIYGICCCCWHNSCVCLSCVRIKLSPFICHFLSFCGVSRTRRFDRHDEMTEPELRMHEQLIAITNERMRGKHLGEVFFFLQIKYQITLLIHSIAVRCARTSNTYSSGYQFHCKCLSDARRQRWDHSITLFMTLVSWFCSLNNQMDCVSRFLLCATACARANALH